VPITGSWQHSVGNKSHRHFRAEGQTFWLLPIREWQISMNFEGKNNI
jgi:hypothetical protein